jgi:hypothetical protein
MDKSYSAIARPLTQLLKKNGRVPKQLSAKQLGAFEDLKTCLLVEPVVLAYPDFEKPFIVACDASGHGLGAGLFQKIDNKMRVVSYISKTLSDTEAKYSNFEREALACVWACEVFRPYLREKFTLISDHRSLAWMFRQKKPSRISKWQYIMAKYKYDFKHRHGLSIPDIDALSRLETTAPVEYAIDPLPCLAAINIPNACPALNTSNTTFNQDTDEISLHLFARLQSQDEYCKNLKNKLEAGTDANYQNTPFLI